MAFIAALIALEKILPWRHVDTYCTAAILLSCASCCSPRPMPSPPSPSLNITRCLE
jgi:hypothetical protein